MSASEPVMISRIAPARRAAFDLLLELRQKPQTHSDALLRSRRLAGLSSADRNLTTALVMGVLRWQIALDERIAQLLTRPDSGISQPVEVALELGSLQLLLFDRIPAHAAIFESVELTKLSGNAHAAGLVNAVLRKIAGSPKLGAAPLQFRSAEDIARVWAHPLWMVTRWARAYGLASAAAICKFDQYLPPTTIRLLAPQAKEVLAEEGIELQGAAFVDRARRVTHGDVTATRALAEGLVRIQDEGSQLIAELAGRGTAILDCCAAPGGKTAILAERNPQIPVLACDIHPARVEAMRKSLARQKGTGHITYRTADAAELALDCQFDLILCDAPCSGTGTLARNPEIRHRLEYHDLRRQQDRQMRLLSSAMRSLVKGGRLVYSTCSLEAEENEEVVSRSLEEQKGFRLLSWAERMRALEEEGILRAGSTDLLLPPGTPDCFLRTLPGLYPFDGFFAALITRD